MSEKPNIDSIFCTAVEIESTEKREAHLERVCGDDPELRQQVDRLLDAHFQGGSILDSPPHGLGVTVDQPLTERPGTQIGPYKLLQQIGEGGMGVVYMAEQKEPVKRRVALKIIKPGMDTRQVIARFEAERQALAMMDHPNIARVLDAGATETGRPYFVMELVKGVPITEFCDQNQLPIEDRLRLFIDVCHAIQHAHHKGVIHRDVKPSNVMITLHDGISVVKVIDFGVAKATAHRLTERTLFTAYGQMIGTPAYMSPEQAEMSGLDIDTRSDVYSLGVLLYELLTGATPFDQRRLKEAAYDEIRRIIREEDVLRPSTRLSSLGKSATILAGNRNLDVGRLARLLAGDLDWIVMMALAKDRNRRYETPVSFAQDVERYLRRDVVVARSPSVIYKLRRFARRYWAATATVGVVATSLLIGTAVATWQSIRAGQAEVAEAEQRSAAERNERRAMAFAEAEKQAKEAAQKERNAAVTAQQETATALKRERFTSYVHRIALAQREWLANEVRRARELLDECPTELRDWEWHYVRRLLNTELLAIRHPADKAVGLAFSPDGKRIASVSDRHAVVYNAANGNELFRMPGFRGADVAFSHDGSRIAVAWSDNATIYDAADGSQLLTISVHDSPKKRLPSRPRVLAVSFSPNGEQLVTGSHSVDTGRHGSARGVVKVWNAKTGKELRRLEDWSTAVNAVAFSADGQLLAACSAGVESELPTAGEIRVWIARTGEPLHRFRPYKPEDVHPGSDTFLLNDLAISHDGSRLASAGSDGRVRIWNLNDGQQTHVLRAHNGPVRGVSFSLKGVRLASIGDDCLVRIWNAARGEEERTIRGHASQGRAIAFADTGLVASAAGSEIRIWNAAADQQARTFARPPTRTGSGVWSVAFSPDGTLLAEGTKWDVRIGEVVSGFEAMRIESHNVVTRARVEFSPSGKSIATTEKGGVKLWSLSTGKVTLALGDRAGQRVSLPTGDRVSGTCDIAFSRDGQLVATVGQKYLVIFENRPHKTRRDVPVAKARQVVCTELNYLTRVVFGPMGRRLATTSHQPTRVTIWDVDTGEARLRLPGGGSGLAISPDGARIASGDKDSVLIWDAEDGHVVATLRGHSADVRDVAFLSNRRLASVSDDRTVRIWDTQIAREVLTLRGHHKAIVSLAVGPGGYLATASPFGTSEVKIWDGREVQ